MRSVNKNGRFYNIMRYFYILIIIKITNNDSLGIRDHPKSEIFTLYCGE